MSDMTPVRADDLPAVLDYLRGQTACAMFPLANLETHGLATQSGHSRAMSAWVRYEDGEVVAFLGMTRDGWMLPVLAAGDPLLDAVTAPLSMRSYEWILGEAGAVHSVLDTLDLRHHPMGLLRDEPHFVLPLSDLVMPEVAGLHLVPADASRLDLLIDWRSQYNTYVHGTSPTVAAERAVIDVDAMLEAQSHVLLMQDDTPLAVTGINARAGTTVQVGGVFTPPARRGEGHARAAVALHLAALRDETGAEEAVLFAASDTAAAAYRAIGFSRIGTYTMCRLARPT
ncbi:GNAT family N-acetyltransferase [Pseudooceanicola nanhaiensis]|uniref:GNAT family N-acetyltransferase n=1 Tax=Pseudooceanicola nanhaiensis TaxID=375761 RepID=UPI001CD597ED|nr:GNAT family N-acetyltransferase [Pseudooceanicola nanhaiensis]MCA0921134.1 GNAT family N-acetyltransferase [Pseudooceanicola nanhaiensis]